MRPVALLAVVDVGRMVPVGGFRGGAAPVEGAADEPVGTVPVGGFAKGETPGTRGGIITGDGMKAVLGTAAAGASEATIGVGGLLTGTAEGAGAVEAGAGTGGGVAAVIGVGVTGAAGVGAGTAGAALTGFGMGGGTVGAALTGLGASGIGGGA